MKVEFADQHLALIQTDQAHKLGLPIAIIKSARNKILVLESATTELTLRNMRSLDYKTLEGSDLKQIRLNDQYRMRFKLNGETKPPTVTITLIGDPH